MAKYSGKTWDDLGEHPSEHYGEDEGCPECGADVDTHYYPCDLEDPMSGRTEYECTECEWSDLK